jgi:hypothetical protein
VFTVDVPGRIDPDFIAPLLTVGSNASQSEYRGVYQYPKGGWVARIRVPGPRPGRAPLRNISRVFPFPSQAAYILARWYESRYGADWPKVVRTRAECGRWCVPYRARYSEELRAWYLYVWESGRRVVVTKLNQDGAPTKRLEVFPSREAALNYLSDWCQRRYGDNAERVLYRL